MRTANHYPATRSFNFCTKLLLKGGVIRPFLDYPLT